jgi:L-threonylcarbamoyladenylate synthase
MCDALAAVDVDGGSCAQQAASTIVHLTGADPRILRSGPVTADAIASVLGVDAASLSQ